MERRVGAWGLGPGGWGLGPRAIALGVAFAALFSLTVSGDAPHVYAITGARIVPAVGPPIESGTVVIRRGLIDEVGSAVRPPADARIIEAKGMTVYPGLIDLSNRGAVEPVASPAPQNPRTTEEVERWKRALLLQPHFMAATRVRADTPDLTRLAAAGITAVLASPPGEVFKGQSALVHVVGPDDEPQIGALADDRRGRLVVRTPVAMHLAVPERPRGNAYPNSLMGTIAFIRQSLLDAQHYVAVHARYQRGGAGVERPIYDAALEALQPALARRLPVVVEADQEREIRRALDLARDFGFDPIIDGGHEAGKAIDALKQSKAPVIYSLNFP